MIFNSVLQNDYFAVELGLIEIYYVVSTKRNDSDEHFMWLKQVKKTHNTETSIEGMLASLMRSWFVTAL